MNPLWTELAARANITLDESRQALLSRYLDLLAEANRAMNLTRIVNRADAEVNHIGDALTLLPYIPEGLMKVADVGSGGGVPGIPLAIARPELQILLIESTRKKAAFLERAVAELGLTNVRVSAERAEDIGQSGARQTFDVVIARAVATLDWLAEWCLPLVRMKGKMLAMKGKRAAEELPGAKGIIKLLGGDEPVVHPVELPGADSHVIIETVKIRRTDNKYPRPATLAKGNPLRAGG